MLSKISWPLWGAQVTGDKSVSTDTGSQSPSERGGGCPGRGDGDGEQSVGLGLTVGAEALRFDDGKNGGQGRGEKVRERAE